jgi:predicted DNA-binding transcriptional regulator
MKLKSNNNNNKINKIMKKLKINKNFKSIIYNLLINSNKMMHVFYINNDVLIIDKNDFEIVDRLLNNNFHKYKVVTE